MHPSEVIQPPSIMTVGRTVGRYVLYTIFIGVMSVWLLELIALEAADDVTLEAASRVWWLQCVLAGATALTLLAGAWQSSRGRFWLLLGALLAAMALVRELDKRWDDGLPLVGMVLPMGVLAVGALICLWWALRRSRPHDHQILASAAPGILWAGWLLVVVFAPVAGQTDAWHEIMGDRDSRDLEWAIEALSRTLGYMLIWIGGVELVLEATRPERVDRLDKLESVS